MFAKHELVQSRSMGRLMHLWRYGHFGRPILVFPSAAGFAHEWKTHGMLEALGDLIGGGKIKLYCAESNVAEAWTRKEDDPAVRIKRHEAFERYVVEELVPFIRADVQNGGATIGVTGCSLGTLYAAVLALKYPEIFDYALCMSGRYEVTHFTNGYSNLDIYLNNPLAFVAGLEGDALERVQRHTHLALVCGQGAFEEGCIEETIALAGVLEAKRISHQRDIWGRDVTHNWVWWRRQARFHLVRRYC